jgi:hypothetical protein
MVYEKQPALQTRLQTNRSLHGAQTRQLRSAAREGRERSRVFDTSAWAAYLETGAGMALEGGGGFIIVPARAAPSNR